MRRCYNTGPSWRSRASTTRGLGGMTPRGTDCLAATCQQPSEQATVPVTRILGVQKGSAVRLVPFGRRGLEVPGLRVVPNPAPCYVFADVVSGYVADAFREKVAGKRIGHDSWRTSPPVVDSGAPVPTRAGQFSADGPWHATRLLAPAILCQRTAHPRVQRPDCGLGATTRLAAAPAEPGGDHRRRAVKMTCARSRSRNRDRPRRRRRSCARELSKN